VSCQCRKPRAAPRPRPARRRWPTPAVRPPPGSGAIAIGLRQCHEPHYRESHPQNEFVHLVGRDVLHVQSMKNRNETYSAHSTVTTEVPSSPRVVAAETTAQCSCC
jgi:hypothetical protein